MNRRRALSLLWGGATGLALPGWAGAVGARSRFRLCRLTLPGDKPTARVRQGALRHLAWELDKRTAVDPASEAARLAVSDKRLFHHPLLFLVGDSGFPAWPADAVQRLRRFLVYGGMLVIDSAESRPDGPFDRSVRQLVKALFPRTPLARLPSKHTLHKSFYLLDTFVGRTATRSYLEAVQRDGRALLVYSQNDLCGAWGRDNFGQWDNPVYPGGQRQRERAIRWGINLVMYALCLDYKADQVHIPFILKRRNWRVKP